jgi:hypothetical protein
VKIILLISVLFLDFLKTVQPLIALGCVFVTSATFLAFLAFFLNQGILKYLRLFSALNNFTACNLT